MGGPIRRKIAKHGATVTGDATYYPGRTKPLKGVDLSDIAQKLQESRYTLATLCYPKGTVVWINLVKGSKTKRFLALVNDTIEKNHCTGNETAFDLAAPLMKRIDEQWKKLGVQTVTVTKATPAEQQQAYAALQNGCTAMPSALKDWGNCMSWMFAVKPKAEKPRSFGK